MKKLNLYIANSRVGLDRGIGKRIWKNRSVIDYFISSSGLFPFIQEFDINDFNPILSDIHNSVHISLKTCLQKQNTKSVKWNDNKRDDFVNMVHNQHNELTSILGDLENIQLNNEGSQQDRSIGYSTIEAKEAARIGYNGFLFPHEFSGEGRGASEYSCGKRNPLYPIRANYFVLIIMYLTCTIIVLLQKYMVWHIFLHF